MANSAPTFFVIDLKINDSDAFNEGYGSLVGGLVAKHGGTFIVAGQQAVPVEGTQPKGAVIIVRFDSMANAKAFLDDPEYGKIAPVRRRTAETHSYLVEGTAS